MTEWSVNGQPVPRPDSLRIALMPLGARERAASGDLVQDDRGFKRRLALRWVLLPPAKERELREALSRDPFFLFSIPAQPESAAESFPCCLLSYESELSPAPAGSALLVRQALAELVEK